jgi:hypothetical protein
MKHFTWRPRSRADWVLFTFVTLGRAAGIARRFLFWAIPVSADWIFAAFMLVGFVAYMLLEPHPVVSAAWSYARRTSARARR